MNNHNLIKKLVIIGIILCILPFLWLYFNNLFFQKSKVSFLTGNPSPTPVNDFIHNVKTTEPLRIITIDPKNGSTSLSAYTTFTVTFNRPLKQNEITVTFSPVTAFTTRITNNIISIDAPNLQDSMNYILTLSSSVDGYTQAFHFTTVAATSAVYNDTVGQSIDAWTKVNRPDVTVYNNLPASSTDFTIQAVSSPGHYSYLVTLNGTDKNAAKQEFLNWLQTTAGLTNDEIAKLDIQYQ